MESSLLKIARNIVENSAAPEIMEAYRLALDSIHYFVVLISIEQKVLYLNKRASQACGLTFNEYQGLDCRCSRFNVSKRFGENCAFQALNNGKPFTYFTFDHEDYECEAAYVLNHAGEKIAVLELITSTSKDIHRLELERELFRKTRYDQLTQLPNREYFCERTRRLLDLHPTEQFVLVHWNVQRFKVVNDVFGPDTGDRVLVNISEKLQQLVGRDGTCGRLGDDNFVFCVPKQLFSENWLLKNASIMIISDVVAYTFKSTFGIYGIDDTSVGVSALCDRAKLAQKSVDVVSIVRGKPFAYYDNAMRRKILEEQRLSSQVQLALQEGQFEVYYQPIYNVGKENIIAAEALVRWEHPDKGLISPMIFIPLFERNGLVYQLDNYVWDKVGQFLAARIKRGEPCVPISVNISRVDFYSTTLVTDLETIIDRYQLPHNYFHVEVTESAYSDDPDKLAAIVSQLRDHGFVVLLDDFGSGYSSLNTLKDMPVDILKVDMKFLDNFNNSDRTGKILASIIRMARWLNMQVIAEGVESEEQVKFLDGIGCDHIQGYFYSRPVPEKDFCQMLSEGHLGDRQTGLHNQDDALAKAGLDPQTDAEKLFGLTVGALGLYEQEDTRLELLRVNKEYCRLMQGDTQLIFAGAMDILKYIPLSERRVILEACEECKHTKAVIKVYVHRKTYSGQLLYVQLRIRYLGKVGKRYSFYIALDEAEEDK